jgi:hypothetical protein
MRVLTPREAAAFARRCERLVAPGGVLPAVADTDAVAFFDAWLAAAPRRNRLGLRALLALAGRAPRPLRSVLDSMALLSYYGDPRVSARLGYDADAVAARGRALRLREGRP